MTQIRMFVLAIVAVFAVSVAASATAVAAENPVLVNSAGGAVTNLGVSGSAGLSFLQPTTSGAPKVECATETSSGTVSTTTSGTGMTSGTATVTFSKCKTAAGKCANKGTEEITGTVSTLLVWVGKESEKKPGILVSILPYSGNPGSGKNQLLSFKCSGVLSDVEGSFIALTNKALGEAFTKGKLIAKESSSGVQEDQKYTENGKEGTNSLYSNAGGGAFGPSAEEIENEETYTTSVKIIEN
jgi:hypothetical protein